MKQGIKGFKPSLVAVDEVRHVEKSAQYQKTLELVVDSMQSPWHVAKTEDAGSYALKAAMKVFMIYRKGESSSVWSEEIDKTIDQFMDAMYSNIQGDAAIMSYAHKITNYINEVIYG